MGPSWRSVLIFLRLWPVNLCLIAHNYAFATHIAERSLGEGEFRVEREIEKLYVSQRNVVRLENMHRANFGVEAVGKREWKMQTRPPGRNCASRTVTSWPASINS